MAIAGTFCRIRKERMQVQVSRFFDGDSKELQHIKNQESLQKLARHNRARRHVSRLTTFVIFALLAAIFAVICLALFFNIEEIEVVGTTRYGREEILSHCSIEPGQSLYEVRKSDVSGVPSRLPYIRDVKITRKLPHTLVLKVVEDEPVFFSELYGEIFILSEKLRVLERLAGTEVPGGLMELVLPQIDAAIVGSSIVFSDDVSARYVENYLDIILRSELAGRINGFDLSDRFNLMMIFDSLYLVELGDSSDLSVKLNSALNAVSTPGAFDGKTPAAIDLTDPKEFSARVDPQLELVFSEG